MRRRRVHRAIAWSKLTAGGAYIGECDEVLCIGGSLDVRNGDPNCGIDNAYELLDLLCELSPIDFVLLRKSR